MVGSLMVLGSVPIVAWVWSILPPGRYPILVPVIPALPLVAFGGYLIKESQVGIVQFADRHPFIFKVLLFVTLLVMLFAGLAIYGALSR